MKPNEKTTTVETKETAPSATNAPETTQNTQSIVSTEEIEKRMAAAETFIKENRIPQALDELNIVLTANINHERACLLTGIILLSVKEFSTAEPLLYNAVNVSNWSNINAVYHLSLLYSYQKEYEVSIRTLLTGMKSVPAQDENAYLYPYGLAENHYQLKNYNISAQYYLLAAQQRTDDIEIWLKASTFYFPNDNNEAVAAADGTKKILPYTKSYDYIERVLLQSIQLNPNNPTLLYHLGIVLFNTQRVDKAIIVYEEAIRLRNDFSEAIAALATAYHAALRFKDALTYYNIAYQKNPQNIILICNFAKLLNTLQNKNDAEMLLEKAIAINPNHEEVAIAIKEIRGVVKA